MDSYSIAIIGAILTVLGFIKYKMDLHYEKNILPNKTLEEQNLYWELEKEFSDKGRYIIPFWGKGNRHLFNRFIMFLGLFMSVCSVIITIFY